MSLFFGELEMKIAVYLTGGIACFKAVAVVRGLLKAGHEIKVVMTKNAERFVTKETLAVLSKHAVLDDLWADEVAGKIPHVSLARWTQLALVVPASADFIAKMVHGIADDAASTAILATKAKKIVVPAMNDQMWFSPATQRNINLLQQDGVKVIEPAAGLLAEGYAGKGRLPEPAQILAQIKQYLAKRKKLKGKKIVVTAGGTIEPIDPVRYIGNYSSGKMGIAIAKAAAEEGAQVVLIYGKIKVPLPQNVKLIAVKTSEEMAQAVKRSFADADALFMAAAVADWRLPQTFTHKLKKKAGQKGLNLKLVKTTDILKTICVYKKSNQLVIGFAAETNDLLANAQKKLRKKGADYIIANDVSGSVFGSDYDKVTILSKKAQPRSLKRLPKTLLAQKLLNLISD